MTLDIPVAFSEIIIPLVHTGVSHTATVTFGCATGSPIPDVAFCDTLLDAWDTTIGLDIDSNVTYGPLVARVGQDGGPPLVVEGSTTHVGGATQTSLPPNVACLYKKGSARGGRRGRGRFFVPWSVANSSVDEAGNIESSVVTAMNTHAAAFLTAMNTTLGFDMVLLHSTGISTEGSPDTVISLIVDPLVATQRRRLGR